MKNSWTAQPSLSRDFAMLSAAIIFILFIISTWVTYVTYSKHSQQIATELEKEAARIEKTLATEMDSANYMLNALGKQIALDPDRDLIKLARILKSFDNKNYIYSIFSWINAEQQVAVSSNRGVLEKPVDTSDRDYVKKSLSDPWKMHIGRPIEGRVSERWVIPVAMGITDYTGKFIGTIMISIDINSLTDKISSLVRRDGISFAIVSKTLIPLTQVSDDKDFVTDNFPTQKLVNVNFSSNPSGLISQGSIFGSGSYAYYRVSSAYPFITLLGYDTKAGDDAMRGLLWPRLLQMLLISIFFLLCLWMLRTRMIKPVIEMTNITSAIARGEPYTPLPKGGPVEINALSGQIGRISDYIRENKRIEEELRNKTFMLKKAKERAEMANRSKSEFLAYICQEMRAPLNSMIGFGQVMKDQLYGPIENRKYRQYASDIYQTGNTLLTNIQDLSTFAKAETDYIELIDRPVDVSLVINKVLRFIADKMQAEKLNVKVRLQEPLPRLIADEFRLQQIIMNLLLYLIRHALPENTMTLEARVVSENKEKTFFALIMVSSDRTAFTQTELTDLASRVMHGPSYSPSRPDLDDVLNDQPDLSLELAKMLIGLHNAWLDIQQAADDSITITIFFGASRIRFMELQEM